MEAEKVDMKKSIKIILSIILLISIAVGVLSTVSLSAENSEQVSLQVTPSPLIDVVLTKSQTSTNVDNFRTDLLNALRNQGVDTTKVNISSIQAEDVNMANSFAWREDISTSIGDIEKSSDGKNVTMVGNRTNAGKNAIWIIPDENQEQEFTFSYDIDYGDSFNAAGMLLRVQQSGNTLTGYMLSFNNTSGSNWYNAAGSNYGAIWQFSYGIGQNSTNMTKTLLRGIDIDQTGTLNVRVTDSQITISGGGMSSSVTYTFSQEYGSGYGFFSDHYSHNCAQIGSFELTNISLTTTDVRKFTEVLREPEWRDNSIKVLVNVSDLQNEELNNTSQLGELVTRLINENIYFTAWGKSANRTQFQNLINANNGNGTFINNTSYSSSIQSTATYIKSLIDQIDTNSQYILLDSQTELTSDPEDVFNNTADENYPYGKWRIVHDYLYYENNIGQFAQSRQYIDDMITQFDKTGKFTITYADNPVNPSEVYVHRRPVALINSSKSGSTISLTSNSYDLDSYSQGNNGISQEEWKYKRTTDSSWTTGKPTSLSSNTDYVVQLRVKDYQNTWSYPTSIYVTNRTDALPIASFGIVNNEITRYEKLEVVDTSYDPYGGTITSWQWEVYKGGSRIYSGTKPLTTYTDLGEYTMTLTVKNNRNLTSEVYSRKFNIIEDSIAPEVVASPESCDWTQSVNVRLNFSDLGGSNFRSYQYAITDSQATPTSWSSAISNASDTITINQEGVKYLHVRAQDNAGNMSEDRVLGEYKIDRSGPNIQVTGDMQTTVIDSLNLNINVTDTLSGLKKISINGQEIQNGTNTFIKNGQYTITAEDNIGNTSTQVININNIYYECDAGLEHPIYSSTYDSCPICGSFNGLNVTCEKHIYNAQNQGVEFTNPSSGTITEYYNNVKENPRNAGTYNYELKVVYEGNEYKTGKTGTYTIETRTLTIDNIEAVDRVYDKESFQIELTGGRLNNLVEGNPDNIGFKLNGAYVEVNTAGKQVVKINEVELTNNNPVNYTLVQPDDIEVEILTKELSIVDIVASDKIYDGTNIIDLSGGRLVGVCDEDEVTFVLPKQGTAENKNIGIHNITIEEITLEGKDAFNYTLKQPTLGEVQAEITAREVYVEGLKGKNRAYNGSDVVEIVEGKLINKVNGDDLTAVVPPTGIAESAEFGKWNVTIEDIVLVGEDKDNYIILQPQEGEIKVSIMREEGVLEIGCDTKKFDRLPAEPYVISNNSTSEVTYKFYIAGTDEEIEKPYDIGDYEVVASMDTDGNYTEDETERVAFSITKPDEPTIKINSKIIEINGKSTENSEENGKIEAKGEETEKITAKDKDTTDQDHAEEGNVVTNETENVDGASETSAENTVQEQIEELRYRDVFKVRMDLTNIGKGSGYASEITVTLPEGIELVEDSQINNQYAWKLSENVLKTNVYSIENDIGNEIFPNDDGRYLELELVVTKQDKEKIHLPIDIQIVQQDKHGDIINYSEQNSANSKSNINTEYKFFDVSVKNRIYELVSTNVETNKQDVYETHQNEGQIIKAEFSDKRITSSIATIKYQITLTNDGNDEGVITKITDILPKGIIFNTNENNGWQIDNTGNISYNEEIELKPGETKELNLLLNWDLRNQSLGSRENQVVISSSDDLDEILINEEKMDITESNNYSSSEILISLATGAKVTQYIIIIFISLITICIGVVLIKKHVLTKEK